MATDMGRRPNKGQIGSAAAFRMAPADQAVTSAVEPEAPDGRRSWSTSWAVFTRRRNRYWKARHRAPDALRCLFQADGLRDIVGESSRL
jgi:hypothetical protein